MDPWLVAALVFFAYGAVIIILSQTGLLQRANIQALGPFLVWRTSRGRQALERLSRYRRVWGLFSRLSVAVVFITMLAMVALLAWQAYFATRIPPEAVNPQYAIGIPGVNPIIPLWYGILGLAVAILVHEGCHGILARAEGIKVRSVGLLLVLFPIGAFVEPDETEMRGAPTAKRQRIYAVGPSSNILLALGCAALFSMGFMGSLVPVEDGALVTVVNPGDPAALAGIEPFTLISMVNNSTATVVDLHAREDFGKFMTYQVPGEPITLHLVRADGRFTRVVVPINRTGETRAVIGVQIEEPSYLQRVGQPLQRISTVCRAEDGRGVGSGCITQVVIAYIGMPVSRLSPTPPEAAGLYQPTGAFASLGGAFWPLADTFYWLFWLNFMVGTFNALPMLPLDGGHMYKDAVVKILRRRSKAPIPAPAEQVQAQGRSPSEGTKRAASEDFFGVPRRLLDPIERRAHTWTTYTSLLVLLLIVWQFVGPRVGQALGS